MKTKRILTVLAFLPLLLPLSAQNDLWVYDPAAGWKYQQGTIYEASLSVHPKGLYLEYGLYLTVGVNSDMYLPADQLEATLNFQLPKGAIVLDNWLWVGEDIVQGKLIDRWSASEIYEGIVNRRRDPSVLFKNSATQYQLRVYPLRNKETRKIKITYLMPVTWSKGKVEAQLPANILQTSKQVPDLYVFTWEDKGFIHPAFNSSDLRFEDKSDAEFGNYKWGRVPAGKLPMNPLITLEAPVQNGIYFSVFEDGHAGYYQLALSPGDFMAQNQHSRILVMIDYESGNSSVSKVNLLTELKHRLLTGYGPEDEFNVVFSKLQVERMFDSWKPITEVNLNAAFDPLASQSMYSNLPGLFASAFDFFKTTGEPGSVLLLTNSDNFANYEQANSLIRDLKDMQNPLPPVYIADVQDMNYNYYYINSHYYQGQEYLYVNLSKASGGYYRSMREGLAYPELLNEIAGSMAGIVTAFDLSPAPVNGICYGQFGTNILEGFPVNQTVTQVGKFIGQSPFSITLTGLYQNEVFSQLLHVEESQVSPADTMLAKMWHGRYIGELESSARNNRIDQEILYESMNNRVLSIFSAFLCLEPSDSVSVCQTCKDESRLVSIGDQMPFDSTGFASFYPNPFTNKLTIEITLNLQSEVNEVVIHIYNLTGQLVFEKTEEATPGQVIYTVWNGTDAGGEKVPAGQYIAMIRAGQVVMSKQIIKTE